MYTYRPRCGALGAALPLRTLGRRKRPRGALLASSASVDSHAFVPDLHSVSTTGRTTMMNYIVTGIASARSPTCLCA